MDLVRPTEKQMSFSDKLIIDALHFTLEFYGAYAATKIMTGVWVLGIM